MLVIGAGLPRTGTLSTRAALEQLIGPCYHGATPMVERPEHMQVWMDALDKGKLDPAQAREVLAGYKAGVDLPFIGWYKELLEIYPTAKVLLTVREPKKWYKSACFIYSVITCLNYHLPYSWFMSLVGLGRLSAFMQQESGGIESGKGQFPHGINGRQNRALNMGEEAAVDFFNDHIEEVRSCVPPSQLLVFDVREGWDPLCTFLDVPVPDTPFPNINDASEVRFVFNTIRVLAWVTMLGVPTLLVYALLYSTTHLPLGVLLVLGMLWGAGRMVVGAVSNQTSKSKQH
eukprot:GFUD01014503.1.p1 GENE.GFUD01014503.1~~GFUD01014503.1.p1  ORF type:complete len:288 (-),score=103.38 GFUD01014503.1:191-1054(-)